MQLINGTVWHSLIHNIMKIINNCRTLTPFNKEIKYIQIYSAVNHNRKACLLEKASEEKGFGHMLSCEQHPAPSLWRLPESLRGSKLMPARALGFVISTLAAHLHVAQSAGEEKECTRKSFCSAKHLHPQHTNENKLLPKTFLDRLSMRNLSDS